MERGWVWWGGYLGKVGGFKGQEWAAPGSRMLSTQDWRRRESLDTLTWCHFEELACLLRLCFDHGQLSHLSWGLRKRQVQLHVLSLGWFPPRVHPTSLPPSLRLVSPLHSPGSGWAWGSRHSPEETGRFSGLEKPSDA